MSPTPQPNGRRQVQVRAPQAADGPAVYALIAACPPLDANSRYCNLLQCTHFAGTSALAERDGNTIGFVSAYRRPDRPDTLFVWQVAVAKSARGLGLARRLLRDILARAECRDLRFLSTTITAGNAASWALFESLAHSLGTAGQRKVMFDSSRHFEQVHETEHEFLIGPFSPIANDQHSEVHP